MKRVLFIFAILLPLFTLAQKLNIDASISGLADDTKIVLNDLENPGSPVAEAVSKNGSFHLAGKLEGPSLLGLMIGKDLKTAVFLGNENVKITGSVNDDPDNWQYTGSKTQADFMNFQNDFVPKFQALNLLAQRIQMGDEKAKPALDSSIDKLQNDIDDYIKTRPSSPVSTLVILSTIGLTEDVALLEKRVNMLTSEATANVFGGHLKKAVIDAKFNTVGSVALDFSQADVNDKQVSLSQFRGKYVLIDFWASWCGPCRRENHNLVKTYNKYKDKNFTVLGVSLDEDKGKWQAAIKKDELTWTHVSDLKGWENEVAQKYRITAIPRNLLLNPEGKIVAKDLRGDDLDDKLEEILGR